MAGEHKRTPQSAASGVRHAVVQPYLRVHRGRPHPGVEECTVIGEIDLATAPLLLDALTQAVDHAELVVTDLSQVALLSAAGVRVLCRAAARARERRCQFAVVATGSARRVLEITGADATVRCYRCRCEAMRAHLPGHLHTADNGWLTRCHISPHEHGEPAESGLRCYVHRVAAGLGLGPESVWYELADRATAYLALDQQSVDHPDQDAALVWDDTRGWAVAIEGGTGDGLAVLAWYGQDPLPAPEDVAAFTKSVLAGQRAGQPTPPARQPADRVRERLTRFL
jgi:anti-anti-sigma factor